MTDLPVSGQPAAAGPGEAPTPPAATPRTARSVQRRHRTPQSRMTGRSSPEFREQRAANICDVDYPHEAGSVDDRQVPETASNHGVSRVTDTCRRLDNAQVSGHQFMDPDDIGVPPIRHQLDKVRLRDEAHRPIGPRVHEYESGHAFAPHQVCRRGHMVVPFYRRHRRPHNVRDVGRGR
jgi:hypothetical protein